MPQIYDQQRFRKTYSFFRERPRALNSGTGDDGGGDVDIDAVIFDDDAAPKDVQNIRADRSPFQSPIDNTKNGIVNFGSELVGGPNAGCLAHYATLGGGEGNSIIEGADYACIPGGRRNQCTANYTFSVGNLCRSEAIGAFSSGDSSYAQGPYSLAQGNTCVASQTGSIALGVNCTADAIYGIALGIGTAASGAYSTAIGWNCEATGLSSFAFGRESQATEKDSFAFGRYALADNLGQFAFSGFVFSNNLGTAQRNFMLLGNTSNNGTIVQLQDTDASLPTFVDGKTYFASMFLIAGGPSSNTQASWTKSVLFHTSGSAITIDSEKYGFINPNGNDWDWNVVANGLNLETYFTGSVGAGEIRALLYLDWIELQNVA